MKQAARDVIRCRELTPALWPALERLFGENGACGGCWCMFWRLEAGERYEDVKGAAAKRRFKKLVAGGKVHGVLAFTEVDGDEQPVGWCAFERRVDLPRLDRAPSLKVVDAAEVWSLPCFYVKAGWRGKGVAQTMLGAAVAALGRHGARIVEGYPVKPASPGKMAAPFAWTGLPGMFEQAGFDLAGKRPTGKQRYRRKLG